MKRFHVHVAVDDLKRSIGFYSALFAAEPSVIKTAYAKWMLDDPRATSAGLPLASAGSGTPQCAVIG
jgi:predicted enzyme related to lactoylglutathione lyase